MPSTLAEAGERLLAHDEAGTELSGDKLSAVEISARVGAVPRRITFSDGSLFETADNDAIDRSLRGRDEAGKGSSTAWSDFNRG